MSNDISIYPKFTGDQFYRSFIDEHGEESIKLKEDIYVKIFVYILENAIEQLIILLKDSQLLSFEINLDYKDLETRFGNKPKHCDLTPELLNVSKRLKNHAYVLLIFKLLKNELQENHSFATILKILDIEKRQIKDELELIDTVTKLIQERDKIQTKSIQQKAEFITIIQDKTENIGLLKEKLCTTEDLFKIRLAYIKDWQQSRIEQNLTYWSRARKREEHELKRQNYNYLAETRAHAEIICFLDEDIRELRLCILHWANRYEKELNAMKDKINNLIDENETLTIQYNELMGKYELHKEEIKNYLIYKEKCKKEKEEFDRKTKAATKIQAWWRGTMYRKGLGKYRKKKGKKPEKKGKK